MTVNYQELLYSWPPKNPQDKATGLEKKGNKPPPLPLKASLKAKSIKLTPRDNKLIAALKKVRCLGQKQIDRLLEIRGQGYDNRLTNLRRSGYLRKIIYGQRGGLYGVVWTGGIKLKNEVKPFSSSRLAEIDHQLGLNQIYLDLMMKYPDIDLRLDWQDGWGKCMDFGQTNLVPDAILTFPQKSGSIIYIEYDRSTKRLDRVTEQVKRYRDFLMSPFAKPNSQVWFVTLSEGRTNSFHSICKRFSIEAMIGSKLRIIETTLINAELCKLIDAIPAARGPITSSSKDALISKEAVQSFIEEAVSIFYKHRIPLPETYKQAAKALYS